MIRVFYLSLGAIFVLSLWGCQQGGPVEPIFYTVQAGELPVFVSATGELAAKRSTKIRGPQGMRAAGIFESTLSKIIPEGTLVKQGDYVATLDRTELANKVSSTQSALDKIYTQIEQVRIDTAMELRALRDQLINNRFAVAEKRLQTQLNQYEADAIQRQTQLALDRAARDYQQLQERYQLKKEQAIARIREIRTQEAQFKQELELLKQLSGEFTIRAPEDGMLIYARTWRSKIEPGSRISAWNPVVAELPDLSDMISKTYVNEVDISLVQKGQPVEVSIDAFADTLFSGKVLSVANIGEQIKGYDAKVFEVNIQLLETDSLLRPAMTTGNHILVAAYNNVLTIPLEGLHHDSIHYVFLASSDQLVQREVRIGPFGIDQVVIEAGLTPGDRILISSPPVATDYPVHRLAQTPLLTSTDDIQ